MQNSRAWCEGLFHIDSLSTESAFDVATLNVVTITIKQSLEFVVTFNVQYKLNYYCVEVCTTTGQNIIDTFSFILSFLDDLLMLKFHSLQMLTFCTFSIFKLIVFRVLHFYITRLRQIEVCNKRKRNFLLFIAKLFIVSRLYINSHQITTFN